MKRRDFLLGVSALAVTAAIPAMRVIPQILTVTYQFTYTYEDDVLQSSEWKQLTPDVREAT